MQLCRPDHPRAQRRRGGQASALNAGFGRSRGDLVIFLDSDDILLPHIAEQTGRVFRTNPTIARVQYRMVVINKAGFPTGPIVPPEYVRMPDGDLRSCIQQLNNYAAWWPPTSGNAFTAWSLRRILPMPEPAFILCADYYLLRAMLFAAPLPHLMRWTPAIAWLQQLPRRNH